MLAEAERLRQSRPPDWAEWEQVVRTRVEEHLQRGEAKFPRTLRQKRRV